MTCRPESYQLTIGNVNAADATVSLTDPLTGQAAACDDRVSQRLTDRGAASGY